MWFNQKIDPKATKIKNTKALLSDEIEVIEHLPFLDKPKFRAPEDVAKRMMVLLAIFQLHLGAPNHFITQWIDENGLTNSLTSDEKKFLQREFEDLPEQDKINTYWNVEAIWALAWIGGFHNNLTFNTEVEDSLVSMTPNIEDGESAAPFIKKFKLRSQSEIFDMLDKFYRVHWFARNLKLKGEKSDKVTLDLIIERRKALEFTCFKEYEWDEISLDTKRNFLSLLT